MPLLIASSSGATDFLSLHQSVKFVAGAYIVVLAVILIYVLIMARRLTDSQRELQRLRSEIEASRLGQADARDAESEPVT